MPTLHILAGPAGVGKSTYIKNHAQDKDIIVSTDAIRLEQCGSLTEGNKHNSDIFKIAHKRIFNALKQGQDVWFDATNISRKTRAHLYQKVKRLTDAIVKTHILHKPLQTILNQNAKREGDKRVPDDVIRHMYLNFQPPRIGVDTDEIHVDAPKWHCYTPERIKGINEPHNSPYHKETLAQHISWTIENAYKHPSTYLRPTLVQIAENHDLGKAVARTTQPADTLARAYVKHLYGRFDQYAGHENVGSLYYLVQNKEVVNDPVDPLHNFVLDVTEVIFHHMQAHNGFSDKYIEKHKMSDDVLLLATTFAKIDSKSKDVDEQVLATYRKFQKLPKDSLLAQALKHPDIRVSHNWERGLHTIKYAHAGVDFNDSLVRNARGLTFDNDGNIVTIGFEKFFNYKQLDENPNYDNTFKVERTELESDTELYRVTEKLDGTFLTLGVTDEGELVAATSSSTRTNFTKKAEDYFKDHTDLIAYLKMQNLSLFFEYTGPDNTIIIPYDKSQFTLIGVRARTLEDRVPFTFEFLRDVADHFHLPLVTSHYMTLFDLLKQQKEDTKSEGFVVENEYGHLVKFKTDYWFKQKEKVGDLFFGDPYAQSKIDQLITIYLADEFDDLIAYRNRHYPTGTHRHLDKIQQLLLNFDHEIEQAKAKTANWSNKEIGLSNYPATMKSALFALRNGEKITKKQYRAWLAQKL